MLNVAAFVDRSVVNGPGARAVVWVQGCARPICPGCWNPAFLAVGVEAERVTAEDLAARILAVEGLDGVTFSGGEPFNQAPGLAIVAAMVRAQGLNVGVFSGYTLAELAARADAAALLANVDWLVAGPYVRELAGDDPLRSSTNQTLHVFGGRFDEIADGSVEAHVGPDGAVTLTGFPDATLRRLVRQVV